MKLHNYQLRAVEFMKSRDYSLLAIEMGLGKTVSVLTYIRDTAPRTALIVAPKRVAETVWKQEAAKWYGDEFADKFVIVSGTPARRKKALASDAPYKIIGRDNVTALARTEWDLLVLDELTSFKSISSQRTKAVLSMTARCAVGLTGTLLANGAVDLYAQFAAIKVAHKWRCKNFFVWRAAYFRDMLAGSGLQFSKWAPRVGLDELLAPVKDNIFTLVAKDYLELPPVTETVERVTLSAPERDAYTRIDNFLQGPDGLGVSEDAKFSKLQTAACGFVYDEEHRDHWTAVPHPAKLEAVAELCERYYAEGEQVLLFYQFIAEARWLHDRLTAKNVECSHVGKPDGLTKWHNHTAGILFAHPASAGHGLNLQHEGRVIIWSSITYNFEHFEQANARLNRQGQTKPVSIHYFLAANTCEEGKLKALRAKDKTQTDFELQTKQ